MPRGGSAGSSGSPPDGTGQLHRPADSGDGSQGSPKVETHARIRVRASSAVTEKPIRGARVKVEAIGGGLLAEGATTPDGEALLDGFTGCHFRLVVCAPGHVRVVQDVGSASGPFGGTVASGQSGAVTPDPTFLNLMAEVRMEPGGIVEGTLFDATTGEGLGGVLVTVMEGGRSEAEFHPVRWDLPPLAEAMSEADGVFRVDGIPVGQRVTLFVLHPGLTRLEYTTDGPTSMERPAHVRVSLQGAATIEGTVTDTEGRPQPGALVYAVPARHTGQLQYPSTRYDNPETPAAEDIVALGAESVEDGHYSIPHAVPGEEYGIIAIVPGKSQSRIVRCGPAFAAGERVHCNLLVEAVVTLAVRIFSPGQDINVDDMWVRLIPATQQRTPAPPDLEDGGDLVFRGITPGEYVLEVSSEGNSEANIPMTISTAAQQRQDVFYPASFGARIEGVVEDLTGAGVKGVRVVATLTEERESGDAPTGDHATAMTGPKGDFVIDGLSSGLYRLTISGVEVACAPVETRAPASGVRLLAIPPAVIRFSIEGKSSALSGDAARVEVLVRRRDGTGNEGEAHLLRAIRSGRDGWEISTVMIGRIEVEIRANGVRLASRTLELSPAVAVDLGVLTAEKE